ncbi:NADPH-dependent ferric siderophore reductase, contains FAD-binding and SIP domains [Flexibacter flexilis DSM 6793]|uniref:NADPH-dependent ferric siderophore reductase, contains FAD-binding and SIP domains n=1 Tax=Flexibacter flexilis DSM 6793 TaxID=927664 RepID=A0A1I1ECB1_9BACT|nr:siderophore-interacting protein [Flexibacter flexilis]SFB84751.1 NADPH-dependent ferric siderophore reductase, contains FAD-binding and SIP domains [Flexibacter flexilis DSM 6793]
MSEQMTHEERPVGMQAILTVKEKIFLTPHYIRIVLEGEGVANFEHARVGDNNKIIVPETPTSPIVLPDFSRGGRGGASGGGNRPIVRTYTLRALDLANKLMTIDFVAHGDNGPASRWAMQAKAGDQLGVLMKVKDKQLFAVADWYCLVADHTALPVVSVILEQLPASARGKAIIEVHSPDDVLPLQKPENVEIIWTFNAEAGAKTTLPAFLSQENWADYAGSKFVFAAAEQSAIAVIQQLLRNNTALERHEWQTYSYWKYGQSEDTSSEERRSMSRRP